MTSGTTIPSRQTTAITVVVVIIVTIVKLLLNYYYFQYYKNYYYYFYILKAVSLSALMLWLVTERSFNLQKVMIQQVTKVYFCGPV